MSDDDRNAQIVARLRAAARRSAPPRPDFQSLYGRIDALHASVSPNPSERSAFSEKSRPRASLWLLCAAACIALALGFAGGLGYKSLIAGSSALARTRSGRAGTSDSAAASDLAQNVYYDFARYPESGTGFTRTSAGSGYGSLYSSLSGGIAWDSALWQGARNRTAGLPEVAGGIEAEMDEYLDTLWGSPARSGLALLTRYEVDRYLNDLWGSGDGEWY